MAESRGLSLGSSQSKKTGQRVATWIEVKVWRVEARVWKVEVKVWRVEARVWKVEVRINLVEVRAANLGSVQNSCPAQDRPE